MALLRQFITESVVLAFVGGAVGVILAAFFSSLIRTVGARMLPRAGQIQLDMTVLFFALSASFVTGIVFGIIPIFYTSKVGVSETAKQGNQCSGD